MSKDYTQYMTPEPGDNALTQLTALAQEQADAEAEVARLQDELAKAQQRLRDVSEFKLPELMEELGMEEFKTRTGLKISVVEKLRGNLSKAKKPKAVEWLDEHGGAALVKRLFTIKFDKGEEAWAKKFAADLKRRKKPVRCEISEDVSTNTFVAHCRRMLEEGEEVPLEELGIYRQRVAKVSS